LLPGIGIPVLVGGDHFDGFRFYQPVWPLLCLLAADQWSVWVERMVPLFRRSIQWAVPVLVLCGWIFFPFRPGMKNEFFIAQAGRDKGEALARMFRDMDHYPTVASITAGGIKYSYPGTVLDLMGLNATQMAHAPGPRTGVKNHAAFNHDVFYAWNPDIVLCGGSAEFDAQVLKGLPDEEHFRQLYIKLTLERGGYEVPAYYSHRFLEQLQEPLDDAL
jgi:arabinofuranosyltransferase